MNPECVTVTETPYRDWTLRAMGLDREFFVDRRECVTMTETSDRDWMIHAMYS